MANELDNNSAVSEESKKRKLTKKEKRINFLSKHPYIGSILLMLDCVLFSAVIFQGIAGTYLNPLGIPIEVFAIVGFALYLLIHYLKLRPKFKGCVCNGNIILGFRLALFFLIYYSYVILQTFLVGKFSAPSVNGLMNSLLAGIGEEILFRAVPISVLMLNCKDESRIPRALIFTSVIFGIVHVSNMTMGAALDISIFQAIAASLIGTILCAVFLRSGNIIPCMIAHFLTDFICFTDSTQVSDSGIMVCHVSIINVIDLCITIILSVIAFYLIRPSKRGEIMQIWKKKWSED